MALIKANASTVLWLCAALALGGRPFWALSAVLVLAFALALRKGMVASPSTALGALWLGWSVFCAMTSSSPSLAVQPLLLLGTGILFYATATTLREERGAEVFLRTVTVAGFATALLLGAGQILGLPVKNQHLIFPPNQNYAATLMAVSFGAMTGLLLEDNYPRRRKICVALSALLVFAVIVLAKSRSALLAAGACALTALLLHGRTKTALGLLSAATLAAALLPQAILSDLIKAQDTFSFSRMEIWGAAAKSIAANPISGVGPGNYEWAYFKNAFPAFDGFAYYGRWSGYAHSHPLQMTVETGLAGLLLFAAFFLRPLWLFIKGKDRAPQKTRAAVILCGLLSASLLEGVLLLPALLLAAFGCAAILDEDKGQASKPSRLSAAVGATIIVFVIGFQCRIHMLRTAANSQTDSQERVASVHTLVKLYPADTEYYYAEARSALVQRTPNPFKALAFMDTAIALNPFNAQYRYGKALILAKLGDPSAETAFRATIALEPNCLPALLELTRIQAVSGRREAAKALLRSFEKAELRGRQVPDHSGYGEQLRAYNPQIYADLQALLSAPGAASTAIKTTGRPPR